MALEEILPDLTSRNKESGSFILTKLWIERAENLELSATAVSVMTALLWHYNPAKKYVFPHQETIAKRVKRSVATVKRAIAELKKSGYIVSSRTRTGNLYAFTKKFFELFEPSESKVCTVSKDKDELCMIHEHVKEQRTNNMAVVVSLKKASKGVEEETTKEASSTTASVSSETQLIKIKEIPDILKRKAEKGEIKNLQGYWASLRPQIKQEYWEKDTAEKLEIQRKEEFRRKEEEKRKQELQRIKEETSKPLNEQFTREEAVTLVARIYKFRKSFALQGIAGDLIKIYNIKEDEIK